MDDERDSHCQQLWQNDCSIAHGRHAVCSTYYDLCRWLAVYQLLLESHLRQTPIDRNNTKDDIDYLGALCHLGQNHRTKAQELLTAIAESNSRHHEAAAQLAEKVK